MGSETGIIVDFRHDGIASLCNLANQPRQRPRQPRTVVVVRARPFVEQLLLDRRTPEWAAADWQ